MALTIETISRSRKVLHRERIDAAEITIGRAYDNDIVLTEPHVDPHHAKLIRDGEGRWWMHDLKSSNGIFDQKRQRLLGNTEVESGYIFTIGKISIRILFDHHPVSETLKISGLDDILYPLNHAGWAVLSGLLFVGVFILFGYYETPDKVDMNKLIVGVITSFFVISLWPLFFALLTRLFKNEVKLSAQLTVSYVLFLLVLLSSFVLDMVSFNLNAPSVLGPMTYFWYAFLAFSLLWLNFYLAFHHSHQRRSLLVGGIVCVFMGLFIMIKSPRDDFEVIPHYDSTLLPPEWNITGTTSTPQFINKTNGLFERVAEEAVESEQ
ncbi:FHA domain-containing protein [Flocculibacter collagenilyticus]|uniref:FHA domain-containing protein n=1 Tax=Flocculibacter collagenilyticus TaxID=2744479 RepID=UPI0018F6F1C1|nr:FHA domain-containing protein [Flocculibacter collagenilyticus]